MLYGTSYTEPCARHSILRCNTLLRHSFFVIFRKNNQLPRPLLACLKQKIKLIHRSSMCPTKPLNRLLTPHYPNRPANHRAKNAPSPPPNSPHCELLDDFGDKCGLAAVSRYNIGLTAAVPRGQPQVGREAYAAAFPPHLDAPELSVQSAQKRMDRSGLICLVCSVGLKETDASIAHRLRKQRRVGARRYPFRPPQSRGCHASCVRGCRYKAACRRM